MSWNAIIDQHRAIEALRSSIRSGRVAHAYLFVGPDGVGKRAVALEFARALQCERGGDEACDACASCRKVGRMVHPDVHLLFAQPKDTPDEAVAERLKLVGENPYAAVDFVRRPNLDDPMRSSNKQAIYHVDRIREDLTRTMSFRPVEGRYKITIMTDADLLNVSAANAFLKGLEEPTPRSVFVLTTSRPDHLLPTILSRCQRIRFDPLLPEVIEEALIARKGLDADFAAALARMADGSYADALNLAANEDLRGLRNLVLDFFRMAYTRNVDRLADLTEQTARRGRDQVKHVLDLMLRWVRDLMLYRTIGPDAPLVNIDQREAIRKFNDNLPDADLAAMSAMLEEAIDLIERNVNINLTLTVLSQRLAAAMRGKSGDALYVPLTEERLSRTG